MKPNCIVRINVAAILIAIAFAITSQPALASGGSLNSGGGSTTVATSSGTAVGCELF
jgi:hypothetical protein